MSDLNLEGLSDKQLRLFAVRCARRMQHLMTDPRSIKALDVAERHAHGQATDEELRAAQVAAGAAADAAWIVADAAWIAARIVVWAARDAAWAAKEAAWAAELAEQQKILDEIRKEQVQ